MLPMGLDPGTRLFLSLCIPSHAPRAPPATLPVPARQFAPQYQCVPKAGATVRGGCPWPGWRPWGDPPRQQDSWMRRAGEAPGHPNLPGGSPPLRWGPPQPGMVHGWQWGASREAVDGCRRWAGDGCRGCGRQSQGRQRQAEGNRQQKAGRQRQGDRQQEAVGGRGREAARIGSLQPPTLAHCQPSVPTASLAADVSRYLPLPRCQISQQTLPTHAAGACPASGTRQRTGRGENLTPMGPTGEPLHRAPQGCSPSAGPPLTCLSLLPKSFGC